MPVRITPLGGLGEIGLNCMAIESRPAADGPGAPGARTRVLIDCGVMFPHETLFGVDLVLPDFSAIVPRAEDPHPVDALLVTHGHEDHIGAIPWLIEALASGPRGDEAIPPVYATRFTRALVMEKLARHGLAGKVDVRVVAPRDVVEIGGVRAEYLQVTHSIVDACGIALETPDGRIVHTGDFKIDPSPPEGERFDADGFARHGDAGVSLLLSDSTNAERAGHTRSERTIEAALDDVFTRADGRVVIAMFASHVPRMRQVAALCAKHGRRLVLEGRSMVRNATIARELGHLRVAPSLLATADEAAVLEPSKVAVMCTGAQAEPASALMKMASGQHAGSLNIRPGDTVVLSSRTIPGNERAITDMVNQLYRCGAKVVYEAVEEIHVSGHAHRDELTKMIELTRPRFFVPVHGEYRHLVHHAELAELTRVTPGNAKVVENGAVLELANGTLRVAGQAQAGRIYVDAMHEHGMDESLVKERLDMARMGLVVAILRDGDVEVMSRGIAGDPDARRLAAGAASEARKFLRADDPSAEVRLAIRRYYNREKGFKPVVLVSQA